MSPTPRPRIKICCINSIAEAQLAIRHGASAVGLVAAMPSGPGPIPDDLICQIAATIPPSIGSFLLTSHQRVADIIDHQRRCQANTLQLVDRLEQGKYEDLRAALPGTSLVQVIHVTGEESFDEACRTAEMPIHALLLDSGNPRLKVKELGGTGRTHNWQISRRIREAVSLPLFLAGGLNPTNVTEALDAVQPFGVDVCSGLRTNGALDQAKLQAFTSAIQSWPNKKPTGP